MVAEICLIISIFSLWFALFKVEKDNMKILDEVFEKFKESVKRELVLTNQKTKIMSIIVEAKKKNEVSYQTLEKIEKELFG